MIQNYVEYTIDRNESLLNFSQSSGAIEYTDYISAEG